MLCSGRAQQTHVFVCDTRPPIDRSTYQIVFHLRRIDISDVKLEFYGFRFTLHRAVDQCAIFDVEYVQFRYPFRGFIGSARLLLALLLLLMAKRNALIQMFWSISTREIDKRAAVLTAFSLGCGFRSTWGALLAFDWSSCASNTVKWTANKPLLFVN